MKAYYIVLTILLSITSCSSTKFSTNSFSDLDDVSILNGMYQNTPYQIRSSDTLTRYAYKRSLSDIFNTDSIEYLDLKFDRKHLIITFQTDSVLHKKSYKGKFKKNYFEVYLSRRIAPIPVFYFGWDWERARIGLDKDKNLLIQYWQYNFGWILFGTAGGLEDKEYTFSKKTGD